MHSKGLIMKKLFVGLVTILALVAFSNFAVADVTNTSTYTQTQNEDHKCQSGKCQSGKCGEGKCSSNKCGGK